MHLYSGQCHCGNARLTLELPKPLNTCIPRACDCDYCTAQNIIYLSHPKGTLRIASHSALSQGHQGSGQAVLHSCKKCHQLIAVTCEVSGIERGTVNASLMNDAESFEPAILVSPKQLSAEEKLVRWESAWLKVIFI